MAPTNSLPGTWDNQDPSTAGVTQIVINHDDQNRLRVHAWGKCEPADCDWGLTSLNDSNGLAKATFDAGFAMTSMEIVLLPDDRLLIVYKADFKDQSGRKDRDHVEFFNRENRLIRDADSLAATALLKKVAETYRNLSAGHFESKQTVEQTGGPGAVSYMRVNKTEVQFGKFKTETTGSGEPRTTISDGQTVWTFFPQSNEYSVLRTSAQKLPDPLNFYTLIDQVREPAKITGHGQVADIDCTILTLEGRQDHVRTLWIDSERHFVLKDEAKDVSSVMDGTYSAHSVTTFSVARRVDHINQSVFSFDPSPTGAKERSELQRTGSGTSIGTLAPNFVLHDLTGKEVRFDELRGKIVVLDFWATWCGPCRDEMPALELLHRQLKDKGVLILGIDDEEPGIQRAYLKQFGYSISSLVDEAKQVSNSYKIGGVPTTILIDAQGTIKKFNVGDASYESLRNAIDELGIAKNGQADN